MEESVSNVFRITESTATTAAAWKLEKDAGYIGVEASTDRFTAADMCAPPATGQGYRDFGFIHSAEFPPGLPSGGSVQYYLSDHTGSRSRTYTLRLPPAPGPDVVTRVDMVADMGRGTLDDSKTWHQYGGPAVNVSLGLAADAAERKIDAVFVFGDLSYAMGYASVWDEWLDQIEGFASRVPLLTNMGNHEYDSTTDAWAQQPHLVPDLYLGPDSGGECGVPATRLHGTPGSGDGAAKMWWSQAVGSIYFVSMNTEVDFSAGSEQWLFLERALAGVERAVTPWVVFAGHRPGTIDSNWVTCAVCNSTDPTTGRCVCGEGVKDPTDEGVMRALQASVGPLLEKYGVAAAFWGHNHAYQRHCAMDWRSVSCAPNGHSNLRGWDRFSLLLIRKQFQYYLSV
jgi:hypothetical protein